MNKTTLVLAYLLITFLSYSQSPIKTSYIKKTEKLSEVQTKVLIKVNIYVPKNLGVINIYKVLDNSSPVLEKSKLVYDEYDSDSLEGGTYEVALLNNNKIIVYSSSMGSAITVEVIVDVDKKATIKHAYSLAPGGTEDMYYEYLNETKIKDKILIDELKKKFNKYFNVKGPVLDSF